MDKPIRPPSEFSRRFAETLHRLTKDAGVTQPAIREQMGNTRAQSFISERLRGVRPVDTDILDACAALMGAEPRELVRLVLREMDAPTVVAKLSDRRPNLDLSDHLERVAEEDLSKTIEEEQDERS